MSASSWSFQGIARQIQSLQNSEAFRGSASNSAYSIAEYIAQPLLMVVSAPYLVLRLGVDQYGIWMLVSAFSGSIGIFQVGLGDATIKYVSTYRGRDDRAGVLRTVSGTLALSCLLGALSAGLLFVAAPALVHHVFKIAPSLQTEAILCIRIGGLLLWIQLVYQVFLSTLKACEEYAPTTKISVALRSAIIVVAVGLVSKGFGIVAILTASVVLTLVATFLQILATQRVLQTKFIWPALDRCSRRELLDFGFYSWIQSAAGVAFNQADRFLIAAMLGAAPLTYYTLCVQMAQQIHGFVAATFNFLFPHISAKHEAGNKKAVRRAFELAVLVNVALALGLAIPLIVFGRKILTLWMGSTFAAHSFSVLAVLAVGFCALALNVAPHFTLLGLGKVRFVSVSNLAGGVLSLIAAAVLIPQLGLLGAAVGRLFYGPATSVNYFKAVKSL